MQIKHKNNSSRKGKPGIYIDQIMVLGQHGIDWITLLV